VLECSELAPRVAQTAAMLILEPISDTRL
jgi:hypothetical protein